MDPDTTDREGKQGSVAAKLMRSHLTVAGVGVAALALLILVAAIMRHHTLGLADARAPAAMASKQALSSSHASVAALRGWALVADERFRTRRRQAWEEGIKPALAELNQLSNSWDAANVERLIEAREALKQSEEVQWWIEDSAHIRGRYPGMVQFTDSVLPVAESVTKAAKGLIDLEARNRVAMTNSMVIPLIGFRDSFNESMLALQDYSTSAAPGSSTRFASKLDVARFRLREVLNRRQALSPDQVDLLNWLEPQFLAYEYLSARLLTNVADTQSFGRLDVLVNMMVDEAVPLARRADEALTALSDDQVGRMDVQVGQVNSISWMVLVAGVGLVVVLALVATRMARSNARRLTAPLSELSTATRALAEGRLKDDIPIRSDDEIGQLTVAFNEMHRVLRTKESSLSHALEEANSATEAKELAHRSFQEVLEASPIGMILVDGRGKIAFANRRVIEIFGYNEAELKGQSVDILVPDSVRPGHAENRAQFVEDDRSRMMAVGQQNLFGRRKDGSEVPLEIGLAPIKTDTGRQVVASILDVTERVEAERETKRQAEAMERANKRFLEVLRASPIGMLVVDGTGKITFSNQRAEEIFGYESNELNGLSVDDLVPQSVRPRHPGHRASFVHEGRPRMMAVGSADLAGRRKDDTEVPLEIGLAPIETDEGRQVVVSILDVTERRKAEEMQSNLHADLEARVASRTEELDRVNLELRQHATALENSNRDLEAFAYVSSHDLQEPLRKIQAFGGILREDIQDVANEDAMESLDTITSAANRMSELISALLVFSRITNQKPSQRQVDLNAVLAEAQEDLELAIARNNATIEVGQLPNVSGDFVQLRQLFENLISNALKFHREDANPEIRIWCEESTGTETERAEHRIHVKDNGIGFEQEFADKIFMPFQRLHGRSSSYKGTGIGLAICRNIVERHSGKIRAISTPEEGAEFIISFPVHSKSDEDG